MGRGTSAVSAAAAAATAGGAGALVASAPPQCPTEQPDYEPGPHAAATLMLHCLQKSAQVGAVAGVPLVALVALRGRARRAPLTAEAALRLLGGALVGGTALLGAASAAKIASLEAEGIADRVYRLHYHQGQTRTDKLANAGGLCASSVAMMGVPAATLRAMAFNGLGGFAVGTALGIAAHVATAKRET